MYPPQREAFLYVFCTASFCKQMYGLLPRTIGKDSLFWLFAAASKKTKMLQPLEISHV